MVEWASNLVTKNKYVDALNLVIQNQIVDTLHNLHEQNQGCPQVGVIDSPWLFSESIIIII